MNEWPEELYDRIVNMLLEELPGRISLLRGAVQDRDLETLASVSHKLRGSVTVLGLQSVVEMAGDVERHARQGELDLAMGQAVNLADKLEHLHSELHETE